MPPMPATTLSFAERDRRWNALRDFMAARALDCVVIFAGSGPLQCDNYYSNDQPGTVIFPRRGEPLWLVWTTHVITSHLEQRERGEQPWISQALLAGGGSRGIIEALRELGCERGSIGVVGTGGMPSLTPEGWVPFLTWQRITAALPDATFEEVGADLLRIQLVKSDEELALVRRAAEIGEAACQVMIDVTRPGVTEADIYGAVMGEVYRQGARGIEGLPLFIHSGRQSIGWGLPAWMTRGTPPRTIQDGDLVMSEHFPTFGGMQAQEQQCIAVGAVDPLNERLAEVARSSYEEGVKAAVPGARWTEVMEAMARPVREAGAWSLTPLAHNLNPLCATSRHSEGIEQQIPEIAAYHNVRGRGTDSNPDLVLEPGMTVELEPNASMGRSRVNLGGTVVVRAGGPAEELNNLPTRMRRV